jgi:hypothetical protein
MGPPEFPQKGPTSFSPAKKNNLWAVRILLEGKKGKKQREYLVPTYLAVNNIK